MIKYNHCCAYYLLIITSLLATAGNATTSLSVNAATSTVNATTALDVGKPTAHVKKVYDCSNSVTTGAVSQGPTIPCGLPFVAGNPTYTCPKTSTGQSQAAVGVISAMEPSPTAPPQFTSCPPVHYLYYDDDDNVTITGCVGQTSLAATGTETQVFTFGAINDGTKVNSTPCNAWCSWGPPLVDVCYIACAPIITPSCTWQ